MSPRYGNKLSSKCQLLNFKLAPTFREQLQIVNCCSLNAYLSAHFSLLLCLTKRAIFSLFFLSCSPQHLGALRNLLSSSSSSSYCNSQRQQQPRNVLQLVAVVTSVARLWLLIKARCQLVLLLALHTRRARFARHPNRASAMLSLTLSLDR